MTPDQRRLLIERSARLVEDCRTRALDGPSLGGVEFFTREAEKQSASAFMHSRFIRAQQNVDAFQLAEAAHDQHVNDLAWGVCRG